MKKAIYFEVGDAEAQAYWKCFAAAVASTNTHTHHEVLLCCGA